MKIRWGRIVLTGVILVGVAAGCGIALIAAGLLASDGTAPTVPPIGFDPTEVRAGPTAAGQSAGPGAPTRDPSVPLEPFDVLTLQYTPYMATLALMDALGLMEAQGYDLRLHDVYSPDVDLDEEGQCGALQSGDYHALATTLDATRKCGPGVAVGVPIGQSAGNDAIVVKPGAATWNDVFEHAVAFTGLSVSEYMACFASHTANQPMRLPLRYDDASEAVDEWLSSGPEQDIQSVVAWEPEISRALASMPGSQVLLSSRDVRILWDVVEFSTERAASEPAAYQAFTTAYYQALRELTTNPSGALQAIVAWAGDDAGRQDLLTTTDSGEFLADLDNEAFATLRDAAFLMEDLQTLRNRLDEAAFYWTYCGVSVPDVPAVDDLILPRFVLEARSDRALLLSAEQTPSGEIFQVTDFTDASAVTDVEIEQARVLFETGIEIEFRPNITDFRDPAAANGALHNAVRFLRTCQDCLLEVQGGAAYPGEAVCPACRPEDSDDLAVERGRRVYNELRLRFEVPEAQLRFVETPHPPQYPGSNQEDQLRLDRRTFLKGLQLAGR